MSLISIRNFAGPLRSKFQMGALAIAILLVLVIRLGISRSAERGGEPSEASSGSEELLHVLSAAGKPRNAGRRAAPTQDQVLDGLVAEGFQDSQQNTQETQENESFDDIRKSLGLE
jgi:hypothetical protein